ncbi:ShlB/FhaC/HecB family hemolysin secretion/activation protein [Blastomonas sp. AAP53]|uniref:ShlB/FhaC/HecB family hemolysin secretion/activation protein n=1 Tax=Blastomonas sp. AAP53 TaxID=1248760 RepID=UPI00035C90B7|nr:ShlB/FhaC/HecB family hemolysin secretion/activation protein [Blastomonas sp. AAP53]
MPTRPFRTRQLILGTVAGAAILWTTAGQAQQVNVPSPLTREEIERPVQPRADRPARLTVEGDIERAPCPLADPAYANVRLRLTEARFNNLGPVAPIELRPLYEEYIGTDQPVAVLCEIRDAVATKLRRDGYIAAVQVPTQRIDNGVVQFEVLYAKLTSIRVRGDAGSGEKLVANYLERLTDGTVFNQRLAERYLLLARDLPGYDIRLTLVPAGTGPGELIGDVTVRRTPFEVDLNVQNMAARDAGPYGAQLRAQFYGLTGMGDRTYVSAYSTLEFREQQIFQAGHEFRVGSEGLTLAGRFTYAWTEPNINLPAGVAAKIDATTLLASAEARYPVLRSQAASVYTAIGLDYVDQDIAFIGPLSRDRLRIAYAQVTGEAIDMANGAEPRWRMAGQLEFRQGLDILGASDPCNFVCALVRTPTTRGDGDPTSTLIRGELSAEAALGNNASVFIRGRGQLAFNPVLSFEEYSGGNFTIGRGYDPGTIVGDDGVGFQAELRGPQITPIKETDFSFQPFVFMDVAWTWDDGRPGDPQRLSSVGGGVRARLNDRFRLDVTVAVPTERAGLLTDTPDPRVLFTLTTLLLPWGAR